MAVTVFIPTALRQFTGERAEIAVEARTVGEALDKVTGEHTELRRHLYGEQDKLRNFVNIYVNDEDIRATQRLETPLKDGDTISIVPAIAGGAATEKEAGTSGDVKVATSSAVETDASALPSLSNDEIARYSRHLIMPEGGMERQRRLKAASVFWAARGACYRCLYPEPPPPGLVPSCAEGGVLGVLPGIVGAIQANEAIKLILDGGEPLINRLLLFDAWKLRFRELKLRKDPACPVCGENPTIKELIDYEEFCGLRPAQAATTNQTEETRQMEEITASELKQRLDRGEDLQIIDVRE